MSTGVGKMGDICHCLSHAALSSSLIYSSTVPSSNHRPLSHSSCSPCCIALACSSPQTVVKWVFACCTALRVSNTTNDHEADGSPPAALEYGAARQLATRSSSRPLCGFALISRLDFVPLYSLLPFCPGQPHLPLCPTFPSRITYLVTSV